MFSFLTSLITASTPEIISSPPISEIVPLSVNPSTKILEKEFKYPQFMTCERGCDDVIGVPELIKYRCLLYRQAFITDCDEKEIAGAEVHDAYNNCGPVLGEHYRVVSATLEIYHGSVINRSNRQKVKLEHPKEALFNRLSELRYHPSRAQDVIDFNVCFADDRAVKSLTVTVAEPHCSAPMIWNFVLQPKN